MNKEQYLQKKEELHNLLNGEDTHTLEKYLIDLENPLINKKMVPLYSVLESHLNESISTKNIAPKMLELIIQYHPNCQYESVFGSSLINSYGRSGDIKNLEKVLNNYAYSKYEIDNNLKYYHESSIKFLAEHFKIQKSTEQIVNDLRSNYRINLDKFKTLINQNNTGKGKYSEIEAIFGAISHFSASDFIPTWQELKEKFSHSLKLNTVKKMKMPTLAGVKNNYTHILKEKVLSTSIKDVQSASFLLNEAEENQLKTSFDVMKWKRLIMEKVSSASSTEFGKFDLSTYPFSVSTLNIIKNNSLFIEASIEKMKEDPVFRDKLFKEFNDFKNLVENLKPLYKDNNFNNFEVICVRLEKIRLDTMLEDSVSYKKLKI